MMRKGNDEQLSLRFSRHLIDPTPAPRGDDVRTQSSGHGVWKRVACDHRLILVSGHEAEGTRRPGPQPGLRAEPSSARGPELELHSGGARLENGAQELRHR